MRPIAALPTVCLLLSLCLCVPGTAAIADDVPQTVKDACRDDYEKHCGAHQPESNEVRDCMAAAFEKLSDTCVGAILDSNLAEDASNKVAAKDVSEQTAGVARPAARHKAKRVAHQHHTRTHRYAAQHGSKPRRGSVARYVNRGTHIAAFYVSKFTRKAFAKVFR